jgi:hypothetical protein
VEVDDREPLGGHLLAGLGGDLGRVIGGVVEDLDFEPVERVIDGAARLDDALGDGVLVEHRELHGDPRQLVEVGLGDVAVVPVLEVEVDQHVTVEAVRTRPARGWSRRTRRAGD